MTDNIPGNADDIIDSRDVIKRIEWLEIDPDNNDDDEKEELEILQAFAEEGSAYISDWDHGATLIAEDHFEKYAEQYAEDVGAVNSDANWPNNHIDWESAAEELKADYSTATFDGADYWGLSG